jgi:hypoxia up-regulated 1
LKYLLAAPYDSDAPSLYATISTATTVQTACKTIALVQFAYVCDLAESFAGERVHDAIVTVPPFFSQYHRDAVADAIEIAGLRTLALINDGAAAAVNYVMTCSFPKPETHIIFDAGASSIRATVVSFATLSSDPKGTTVIVAGVGYDLSTGGTELNCRLQEMLDETFIAKHNDVYVCTF